MKTPFALVVALAVAALFASCKPRTIDGRWDLSFGVMTEPMVLKVESGKVSGTVTIQRQSALATGIVVGNKIELTTNAGSAFYTFDGTISGDRMEGSFKAVGGFGSTSGLWVANRNPVR